MQEQLAPGSLSAAHIFRLLEAGAKYETGPQSKKPLMDICLERAAPAALERDILACIQRTKNEKLRAYAQEMLERVRQLPIKVTSGVPLSDVRQATEDTVQSMHSSVLGTLIRHAQYDLWESAPIAVPLYNNEKIAVIYDFSPKDDPAFLADADKAMAAFLKLDDAFRLSLSERASEHAKPILNNWIDIDYKAESTSDGLGLRDKNLDGVWLTAFVAGEKTAEDVWRMVGNIWEIYVARNTADGLIYVVVLWNCLWDEEHGFQLVFREGAKLTRISDGDGELTD